ncbi:MAG: translesion DNA synthesis-associated protein ImuA [Natronospirillum sp.]|uniref:translesion DNA synthesis-associated protein ImuA n=1 Tax=Natronospirillum sp. TaxID=2812955 RepID=UPI0025FA11C7|nr:translesion DNA synthesis-associated protein ImuA [Natronospirillum sp.]MCH8552151.1 translesion DNA synthesis-associated protein ImuA [Natronospirillum sp.]
MTVQHHNWHTGSARQEPDIKHSSALDSVIGQGQVWQGRHWPANSGQGLKTGHAQLDALLAEQGWPRGALSEVLYHQSGIGEMQLLVPALAELSRQDRWIMLIAPPFVPNAAALEAAGVDTSRLLVVQPGSVRDLLWTIEESLRSGTCSAVLAWPQQLETRAVRRLQLAAESGRSLGLLFRPERQANEASPAALRLRVAPTRQGLTEVTVLKQRGGFGQAPAQLDLGLGRGTRHTGSAEDADLAEVIQGPWQ